MSDLELILNDLSWAIRAPDIPVAHKRLSTFVATLSAVTRLGVKKSLRADTSFNNSFELASGYTLGDWYRDKRVDEVQRRYLLALLTKVPYLVDLANIYEKSYGYEFQCHGLVATGLGVCYLLEGLALSMASSEWWSENHVNLNVSSIDESEIVRDETVVLQHASDPHHVRDHRDWIQQRVKSGVSDGSELWRRRADLLPSLQLCDFLEGSLGNLGSRNPFLTSVKERLFDLQRYADTWTGGFFDRTKLGRHASPESEATLNEFAAERTFRCPDGQIRLFSWHFKLHDGWRVYFYPLPDSCQFIVGYIGLHLRTARYK